MAKEIEDTWFEKKWICAIVCSSPIFVNPKPWKFGRLCRKDRRINFTANARDIVYLYRDTVIFDASLFDSVIHRST